MRSQRREFFHIRRRRLWKSLPVGWRPILKASTWPGKRPTRRIGALAITREAASFSVRAGEQALGQTANTLASMGRREDRYRYLCLTPCSAYDRIIQILCLYRLAIGLVPTRS